MVDEIVEAVIKEGIKEAFTNMTPQQKDTVMSHSLVAGGAGFLPIPGVDMLVLLPNLWHMYSELAKDLGIPMSQNIIKTIGTGIFTNLVITIGVSKALSFFGKLLPGPGTIFGVAVDTIINFAITYVSGAVFIVILENFRGSIKTEQDAKDIVNGVLKNKSELKDLLNEAKKEAKKHDFSAYKDKAQIIADEQKGK